MKEEELWAALDAGFSVALLSFVPFLVRVHGYAGYMESGPVF